MAAYHAGHKKETGTHPISFASFSFFIPLSDPGITVAVSQSIHTDPFLAHLTFLRRITAVGRNVSRRKDRINRHALILGNGAENGADTHHFTAVVIDGILGIGQDFTGGDSSHTKEHVLIPGHKNIVFTEDQLAR